MAWVYHAQHWPYSLVASSGVEVLTIPVMTLLAAFDRHTPEDSDTEASTSESDKRTWETSLFTLVGRLAAPATFLINGARNDFFQKRQKTVASLRTPREPHAAMYPSRR